MRGSACIRGRDDCRRLELVVAAVLGERRRLDGIVSETVRGPRSTIGVREQRDRRLAGAEADMQHTVGAAERDQDRNLGASLDAVEHAIEFLSRLDGLVDHAAANPNGHRAPIAGAGCTRRHSIVGTWPAFPSSLSTVAVCDLVVQWSA